jgi:hypothetical protein
VSAAATVVWRRLDVVGTEFFQLSTGADGPRLEGGIIAVHDGAPMLVDYEIACTRTWETRRVALTTVTAAAKRRLELTVDERRRWWADGRELRGVTGCIDVDLGLTPSTNTLPLRRLGLLDLPEGESREVTAAWVRFPQLTIEPLPQRYTRLAGHRYRYESASGAFTAELEVDERGLVVSYPPYWERVRIDSPR